MIPLLFTVTLLNPPPAVEQARVDALWEFVQLMVDVEEPVTPEVYFTAEDEPLMTPRFMAYYYSQTHILRIAPKAWDGPLEGYIYLVIGHEMQHYALRDELPLADHHCQFAERRYWRTLAAWLLGKGWALPYVMRRQEEVPCQ